MILYKAEFRRKHNSEECKMFHSIARKDLLPERVCCPWRCAMSVQHAKAPEQAREDTSPRKIDVTSKSPVGDISVVTLIRTDTTLDHSQKAEKVCFQLLWIWVMWYFCETATCLARLQGDRSAFCRILYCRGQPATPKMVEDSALLGPQTC